MSSQLNTDGTVPNDRRPLKTPLVPSRTSAPIMVTGGSGGILVNPPGFGGQPHIVPGFGAVPGGLGHEHGEDSQNPPDKEGSTIQGLNVRSTTLKPQVSSSTPSCLTCDSCLSYDYSPAATQDSIDVDVALKRRDARRIGKRLNNNAVRATKVARGQCKVSVYTQKPDYPGPGLVANNERNPAAQMFKFFATATYWAVPTSPPCNGAPGWFFYNTSALDADPDLSKRWTLGKVSGSKRFVNIDHVYEVSLLDEFFAAQFAAGFTCNDITTLFDVIESSTGSTRLDYIFSQLASFAHPDFLGMDSKFNTLKGSLWNPGLQGYSINSKNADAYQQQLSNLAVVLSMVRHPSTIVLFTNTNTRIYEAFGSIDQIISAQAHCNNSFTNQAGNPMSATWAGAYKSWMTSYISGQNDHITSTVASLMSDIPTQYDPRNTKHSKLGTKRIAAYSRFMSNLRETYGEASAFTFPTPSSWPAAASQTEQTQPECTLTTSIPTFTSRPSSATSPQITQPPAVTPPLITPTPIVSVIAVCDDGVDGEAACDQIGGRLVGYTTITIFPTPVPPPTVSIIAICDDGVGEVAACGQIGGRTVGYTTITISPAATPPGKLVELPKPAVTPGSSGSDGSLSEPKIAKEGEAGKVD
ncbi:hypothetical protein MMC21_004638 [Puttea exsequens]|nr:hypothetical protein [Puttea exsequens]